MALSDQKRRNILKKLGLLGSAALVCSCRRKFSLSDSDDLFLKADQPLSSWEEVHHDHTHDDSHDHTIDDRINEIHDKELRLIEKSRHFDSDFSDDVFITGGEFGTLKRVVDKLGKLQKYVGHGHFNIVDWDDGIAFTRKAKGTGRGFEPSELNFLEKMFHEKASRYGFMGEKVFLELGSGISRKNAIKVPYSGHYLVKGESYDLYRKIKAKLGRDLILTSGARGLMKQFHLFLSKVIACHGNASKASRSIAPPGYSFHGRGDFDIGSRLLGERNFTLDFAKTEEYKKLIELGFIDIRYEKDNLEGVRFEPWHIKVT